MLILLYRYLRNFQPFLLPRTVHPLWKSAVFCALPFGQCVWHYKGRYRTHCWCYGQCLYMASLTQCHGWFPVWWSFWAFLHQHRARYKGHHWPWNLSEWPWLLPPDLAIKLSRVAALQLFIDSGGAPFRTGGNVNHAFTLCILLLIARCGSSVK